MCMEMRGSGEARRFDPNRCPLLQGLSPEEADRVMRTDPRFRACVASTEAGTPDLEPCAAEPAEPRAPSRRRKTAPIAREPAT